ncbi:MAG: PIG-L family deacetylase, partial [Candidatus Glassbacteria bacterium]
MGIFQELLWEAACRGELSFLGNRPTGRRWLEPPSSGTVLALSPHQDDPDSVAVTLRVFAEAGCRIRYAILCSSHGGVTDQFALAHAKSRRAGKIKDLIAYKRKIRNEEQAASAALSGLVDGECRFVEGAEEDERGNLAESPANLELVAKVVEQEDADIVVLPYGDDTNAGHVNVYRYLCECAPEVVLKRNRPLLALFNHDPKTIRISHHLVVPFDGEAARWKAALLREHKSQHERNLQVRGYGFDERILR